MWERKIPSRKEVVLWVVPRFMFFHSCELIITVNILKQGCRHCVIDLFDMHLLMHVVFL